MQTQINDLGVMMKQVFTTMAKLRQPPPMATQALTPTTRGDAARLGSTDESFSSAGARALVGSEGGTNGNGAGWSSSLEPMGYENRNATGPTSQALATAVLDSKNLPNQFRAESTEFGHNGGMDLRFCKLKMPIFKCGDPYSWIYQV